MHAGTPGYDKFCGMFIRFFSYWLLVKKRICAPQWFLYYYYYLPLLLHFTIIQLFYLYFTCILKLLFLFNIYLFVNCVVFFYICTGTWHFIFEKNLTNFFFLFLFFLLLSQVLAYQKFGIILLYLVYFLWFVV